MENKIFDKTKQQAAKSDSKNLVNSRQVYLVFNEKIDRNDLQSALEKLKEKKYNMRLKL